MTRNQQAIVSLVALLAGLAPAANAQTDVPRGGAVITPGAGSGQIVIEVKNKTGKDALDLSVSVFRDDGGAVPNITGQDIVQNAGNVETDDVVDDDGNGKVDAGETDTTDSSPGTNCKSILTNNGPVKSNDTAKVTVTFDGPLPEGAKIRVKFSEKIGDTHYDMCMAWPMDDGGVTGALCQVGPPQMSYQITNTGPSSVGHLTIPTHFGPVPITGAELGGLFSDRIIVIDDDSVEIYGLGLAPGDTLDLGLTFDKPIEFVWEQCQFPIIALPETCRADVNEDGVVDTRDYIEFLNLYNLRDPIADWNGDGLINTLDFLAYQNDWTTCR